MCCSSTHCTHIVTKNRSKSKYIMKWLTDNYHDYTLSSIFKQFRPRQLWSDWTTAFYHHGFARLLTWQSKTLTLIVETPNTIANLSIVTEEETAINSKWEITVSCTDECVVISLQRNHTYLWKKRANELDHSFTNVTSWNGQFIILSLIWRSFASSTNSCWSINSCTLYCWIHNF